MAWNWLLKVLIAADSRVSMNSTANQAGMASLMYMGIIASTSPPAAAMETFWTVPKKCTLVSAPTTNATPVIIRMKIPPTGTARFSSLPLLTVM